MATERGSNRLSAWSLSPYRRQREEIYGPTYFRRPSQETSRKKTAEFTPGPVSHHFEYIEGPRLLLFRTAENEPDTYMGRLLCVPLDDCARSILADSEGNSGIYENTGEELPWETNFYSSPSLERYVQGNREHSINVQVGFVVPGGLVVSSYPLAPNHFRSSGIKSPGSQKNIPYGRMDPQVRNLLRSLR